MVTNKQKTALPPDFVKVLLQYIKKNYLHRGSKTSEWNVRDTEYFSKGIVALNHSFTRNRSGQFKDYFNEPVMRSGYLSYFLPVNAMKVFAILRQFPLFTTGDGKIPTQISIADIGCGPLTLSFGFLFHLLENLPKDSSPIHISIDAYELNRKILEDGIHLLDEFLIAAKLKDRISVKVTRFVGDLFRQRMPAKQYDYILLGNFLNELDARSTQQELVEGILQKFGKKGGKVLFLEPGSKKFSRDLQALRDDLIGVTDYRVLAPCLHQSTCPLNLTAKGDWCNFRQQWQAPQFISDFDELTDMKKEYLLYSFLLLQNKPDEAVLFHTPQEYVAISDRIRAKGRFEVVGCGPAGRIRFIRSNADEAPANAAFDQLSRGSYFTVPEYKHRGQYELVHNSSIKKTNKIILN